MCGIVYVLRKDGIPAHKQLLRRYERQEMRGADGFGYVALDKKNVVVQYKRHQTEREVRAALKKCNSAHILFHHRLPTSTINVPEAAHPIKVQHRELQKVYYVVHNGIISNPTALRQVHEQLGYKYTTAIQTVYRTNKKVEYHGELCFNDSESLAIEIARTLEGLQPRVGIRGSAAYVVLEVDKSKKATAVYYGTNGGNPLTIQDTDTGICIASEGGNAIPHHTCYRLDLKTKATTMVSLPMEPHIVQSYFGWKSDGIVHASNWDEEYSGLQEEYEEQEYLQAAIDECRDNISVAEKCEEPEELERLQIELQALEEERRAIRRHSMGF